MRGASLQWNATHAASTPFGELAATVGDRLQIVELDAMEFDLTPLAAKSGKIATIANLPYNIATLLIGWLKQIEFINRMVLMFQSEVADRLIAAGQQNVWAHIHCRPMALRGETGLYFTRPRVHPTAESRSDGG